MTDVFNLIARAFDLYKEKYEKVITAFIALLAIMVVVGVLSVAISASLSLAETACGLSTAGEKDIVSGVVSNMICEYTQPSSLIQTGLGWITEIFVILIVLAVLKPLEELVLAKEKISKWTDHLSGQVSNSIKLFIFDTLVNLIALIPIIILLSLLVPDFINLLSLAASEGDSNELTGFLMKSLSVLMTGLVIGLLIQAILTVLLTFLRVELALANQGIISAVGNSIKLVKDNIGQVIMFHLIWFLISIVVGILTLITCCMAVFVAPLVSYLLVLPVKLLSEIILWKELKKQVNDTVFHGYPKESTVIIR